LTSDTRDIHINRLHSGAICQEIGERFRVSLGGEGDRLPLELRMLIARLAKAESPARPEETESPQNP
jgi:hypothetical protein